MKHFFKFLIRFFIVLLAVFSGTKIYGQIADGSIPASFSLKSAAIVPRYQLDSVHIARQTAADKMLGIPNRYGVVEQLEIDIRAEGLKTIVGDLLIWRYEIDCPDALSLGVTFKSYRLPEGAKVFIYNPDRTLVFGGFTSFNNKADDRLSLAEFSGNRLIIEYDEPKQTPFNGTLVVGSVSKAYLDFPAIASTIVRINCPEGDDWQTEKHAVCLMSFHDNNYSYYCSGALVNNTRGDLIPYFLTANHCLSTQSLASTLVTYFNYEYAGCTGSVASKLHSLSGSSLVSTNGYSDFSLLRLSEYPPASYTPYFAGWDASDTLHPKMGACIHHPNGGPKAIAIDDHPFTGNNYQVQWDDKSVSLLNTHWEVFYDVGSDASGSSGGPLFDQNHRIIGQLHGGDTSSSLFGKFSLSWNYAVSADKQLKAWLDPDNTQIKRLDGIYYDQAPLADFAANVAIACLNTVVTLTDKSKYRPKNWRWTITPATYKFVNQTNATSQNPDLVFLSEGVYTVSLTVTNNNGSDTVTRENLILATSNLPVAFQNASKETMLCGYMLKNYQLIAGGASNYTFELTTPENFDIRQNADTLTLTLKNELPRKGPFDTYVKVTGTHGACSASDSILIHVLIPPNDDAANAQTLKLGNNAGFNNDCGTTQPNEPVPPGISAVDHSVWFSFRGPSSGRITIQTQGVETKIAVYEASSAEALLSGNAGNYTLLGTSSSSPASQSGAVIEDLPVDPRKIYWLQVEGQQGMTGNFSVNLLGNSIEVYPNPSAGVFHLTISSFQGGEAELTVYALSGQQLVSKTVPVSPDSNTVDLDLSAFRSGFYVFRANINGLVMTKKLMLIK
jgi:PKD repeat protein